MTKAEEKAWEKYPEETRFIRDYNQLAKRQIYQEGYEQAEKDLAQDFHADTLIGDKDYAVFHADVEDLNGDLYNYCQEQGFMGKVKVIIVEDPGAVEIS